MKLKLFNIFDKISQSYELGGVAPNQQMFIRENVAFLVRMRPLSDLQLYEVGEFDTSDGSYNLLPVSDYLPIQWSDYNFPETRAEALAPLNIETSSEQRIQYENDLKHKFKTQGE